MLSHHNSVKHKPEAGMECLTTLFSMRIGWICNENLEVGKFGHTLIQILQFRYYESSSLLCHKMQ